MFNWFGRKSAPARFGVPWLPVEGDKGFARGPDGVQVLNRATGEAMVRRNSAWEAGVTHVQEIQVDGRKVLGGQQPQILAPVGGSLVDLEARAAISELIASLQAHGLISS